MLNAKSRDILRAASKLAKRVDRKLDKPIGIDVYDINYLRNDVAALQEALESAIQYELAGLS